MVAMYGLVACSNDEELTNEEPKKIGQNPYFVSKEEAIASVEALLVDIDGNTTRGSGEQRHVSTIVEIGGMSITRAATEEVNSVYLMNFENDEGFAIASTDNRTTPIFCLTDEGSLNPNDSINDPGLAIFLSNLEEALADTTSNIWLSNSEDTISVDEDEETEITRSESIVSAEEWYVTSKINPRLYVKWNQRSPYNAKCPTNCLAGCVAIATGQICSYFKFPTSYNSHTYNWNDILRKQSYSYYNSYPEDLPILIHDIGLGVNMKYGKTGSSADSDNAIKLLKKFGYSTKSISSNKIHSLLSANSNMLIYTRGNASRTNRFLGLIYTYSDGHAWVIDGCMARARKAIKKKTTGIWPFRHTKTYTCIDSQELYHCNFGWDGSSNGYYVAGAFNDVNNTDNSVLDTYSTSNEDEIYQYKNKYWSISK